MIELAREMARWAHSGQVDKSGNDYFTAHVEPIAVKMEADGYAPEYVATAYLHDVVEDTHLLVPHLLPFFPVEVIHAVSTITKDKGEDYDRYLRRVKYNKIAKRVKYYDIQNNLAPRRMDKLPKDQRDRLKAKYKSAMDFLDSDSK